MQGENNTIGLALVLSGTFTMLVCLPLLKGKIKPNALYGIRVAKAFESDRNWFKINHYGARQMMLWAGMMIVLGLAGFFLPLQGDKVLLAIVGFAPVFLLLVPILRIYRYSKTL